MSAAAKDPEGSGLDTLSPLNVKGNRGPLHSRTGGVVRTGARAPSWPPPQPSTPHSQAHCPGGGGPWLPPLSPSPCPRILPPPPRPSAPTSGDAVVHATEMGGRGQEFARPRGRPLPGRTGDLGRPLLLQSSGTCSLGPHLQGALPAVPRPRRTPCQSTGYLRCPQAACAFRPGGPSLDALREPAAPSWADPEVQGHRVPTWGPWVTRGKVPGSGAPSSTPGRGRYGLTRGVRVGLAPGPGGGEDQHREEKRRRRGPHGGRQAGWRAVMWHSGRGAAPLGLPPPTSAESGYSTAAPGTAQSDAAGGTKERSARFRGRCSAPRGGCPPWGSVSASHLTSRSPADPACES